MNRDILLQQPLPQLLADYPFLPDFFTALSLNVTDRKDTIAQWLTEIPTSHFAQFDITPNAMIDQCLEFIDQMMIFRKQHSPRIERVTIKAGVDKTGQPETQDLELHAGEVICVVGPTGSGKSQLLADIESLAQRDTPSRRQILLNGQVPDEDKRMSGDQQLVAQLSQNMNFVMDLTVQEFVSMHAESRLVSDVSASTEQVFALAVELAGEPFSLETPVTALSGGQSRALMIADVACLSASPIVLIDEIENAGVDRLRALELLVKKEKMVLIATHDPLLALSGDRRLVIRNGGIACVLVTSDTEREALRQLAELDTRLARLRDQVRQGERVTLDWWSKIPWQDTNTTSGKPSCSK